MNTIIGVFDDPMQARRAVETLRDGPLPLEDVSIIAPRGDGAAAADSTEDVSAGEGAAVGAVWGGLVGLAALLIPGVGPFIAGGALFAALTGAVTGAVVGGIAAALIDFSGIPEADARGYEEQVRAGKTLVAVKARDEDSPEVRRILTSSGADVRDTQRGIAETATAGRPTIAMYDESGRRVSDDMERAVGGAATGVAMAGAAARHGIYDSPARAGGRSGESWTKGEWVAEGEGGPRKDTGEYDAHQWVGEGQGETAHRPGDAKQWTSGEWVGEGQGEGPRKDTGEYDAEQWVGEGQGEGPASTDRPAKRQP
ncbi:MAG: DUF1269 domain-containing protein [Kouleothrix sp.]|nr:DUF1269 domain-containing protein [Kouleothrix sp.]